jgi:ribosomal protein S18 acetylase RimI-like enzyme
MINPTIVDTMKAEEADALSRLFSDVLAALPYYNDTAKRSELKKYAAESLRCVAAIDPGRILVAKLSGEIVGFCFSKYDDDLIWIDWFGVHPAHRRSGIASALLEELEQAAAKAGVHKIWCDCRTENDPSKVILIYRKYSPICTIKKHWYGQDFILWEKLVS